MSVGQLKKPLFFQWSGRPALKSRKRDMNMRFRDEMQKQVESTLLRKVRQRQAVWQPFYAVYLLGPVSLRDREAALSYVAPLFL